MSGFNVSDGATYAVLFSVLGLFTILAIASADYFHGCLPRSINNLFVLNKATDDDTVDEEGENANRRADFFLSARNSASGYEIALSFFASGMGAWILYGSTEMGATPSLSWLAVIGYSFASSFPAIVICFLGPMIKERCGEKAFNLTDYGRQRYGRVMQLVIALMSVFYMFIYIVAEMTSISNIYALINGQPVFAPEVSYTTSIAVSTGVITIFYTSIGGLPASIVTDKFQGIAVASLVLILIFAVSLNDENKVTKEEFALASNWTLEGFYAMVTLTIAILSAEIFNQGTWQRVWAAKSVPDMKRGFIGGSLMVFLIMMFFGVMGMIAYALDPEAYDNFEKFAFLSFFDILEPLNPAFHVITLIFVTSLAASSMDSLQNALMSVFSSDMVNMGQDPKWVARILIVILNIPAVILSAKQYSVLSLFLVADLVCATALLPVLFGLITEDKMGGLIPAPTEFGAFMGCFMGVVTVCVTGIVVDAPGGLFDYFWLDNGAICALCGSKTMITFIVTPLFAGLFCLIFSKLDIMVRGEDARKPLFFEPAPEVTKDVSDAEKNSSEEEVEASNEEEPNKPSSEVLDA